MRRAFTIGRLALLAALVRSAWGADVPVTETFDDDSLGSSAPIVQGSPWSTMSGMWTVETAFPTGHLYRCVHSGAMYGHSFLVVSNIPGSNLTFSVDFGVRSLSVPDTDGSARLTFEGPSSGSTEPIRASYMLSSISQPTQHRRLILTGPGGTSISSNAMPLVLQVDGEPLRYRMRIYVEYATPGDTNSALTVKAYLSDTSTVIMVQTTGVSSDPGSLFGFSVSGDIVHPISVSVDFDNVFISHPLQQPSFSGISVADGAIAVRLTNLTVNALHCVEQSASLSSSPWTTARLFRATAASTNLSQPETGTSLFYRVRSTD